MSNLVITAELCKEDRARLDAILAALQTCGTPFPAATETPAPATETTQDAPKAEEPILHQPTAETPAEPTEAPAPVRVYVPSPAEVQQKVVTLAANGKKAEVRAIVTAYAPNVSKIPEDKLAEVWVKLTALEG